MVAIPHALGVSLQGSHGPVSIDLFHTKIPKHSTMGSDYSFLDPSGATWQLCGECCFRYRKWVHSIGIDENSLWWTAVSTKSLTLTLTRQENTLEDIESGETPCINWLPMYFAKWMMKPEAAVAQDCLPGYPPKNWWFLRFLVFLVTFWSSLVPQSICEQFEPFPSNFCWQINAFEDFSNGEVSSKWCFLGVIAGVHPETFSEDGSFSDVGKTGVTPNKFPHDTHVWCCFMCQ